MLSVKQSRHSFLTTTCLTAALAIAVVSPAGANPVDGTVVAGAATISATGPKLDIVQTTDRAVIDWRSFNIAPNEHTQFHQPNSSSIAVNRVTSVDPSTIAGKLSANGNVVLINPNGVFFSKTATVDVNGLVATTADIDNAKFMAGSNHYDKAGNANAAVVNEGTITAKDAGLVGLVAPNVINSGTISAKLGRVQLASGDTVTVDLYGDGLMEVKASDALTSQVVANSGIINAAGGTIVLSAAAGRATVNSVVKVSGELNAPSVSEKNGTIIIAAEGSNAVADNVTAAKGAKTGSSKVLIGNAVLNASGRKAGERGGKITVTGDHIAILDHTVMDASGDTGLSNTTAGLEKSAKRAGSAGGEILVGGDYLGQGTTSTAKDLYVSSGALFLNDALTTGDAGRTIFWSDNDTAFYGNVYARALGGNGVDSTSWSALAGGYTGDGGFVETSGHNHLDAGGYVNLTASNGARGTYFLDPTDITIYGNTTSVYNASGLAAYYSFDEGLGTALNDLSGNGNNGTLFGGTAWNGTGASTPQATNGSLAFNGSNSYVSINDSNSLDLTNGYTFSFWMQSAGSQGNRYILSKRNDAGNDNVYSVLYGYASDTVQTYAAGSSYGYPSSNSNIGVADTSWHLITYTYDGTNFKSYKDGSLVGTVAATQNLSASSNNLLLGTFSTSGHFFSGSLDEMRIYNNALSANNVSELYGSRLTVAGLEAMSATANISLQASNNITLDFGGDSLDFTSAGRSLTLTAGNQITTASTGSITTNNGAISMTGSNGILLNHAFSLNSGTAATTLATTNAPITFTGAMNFGGNTTLNAGTGTISTDAITMAAAKNLTFTADDVAIGGNLSGSGSLTIAPYSQNRAVRINRGGSGLSIETAEIGRFQNGWSNIYIGRDDSTETMYMGDSSWVDPVTFRNNASRDLSGNITATDGASVTILNGWTDLWGSITTNGGGFYVTTNRPDAAIYGDTTGRLYGFNGSSITTNGGIISLQRFIPASGTITLTSGAGGIRFNSLLNRSYSTSDVNLNLGAVGGQIRFDDTVDGIFGGGVLNLTANAASYLFTSAWGNTTPLGNVSLTSISGITLPVINASSLNITTTANTADITGPSGGQLITTGAGGITINAGRDINFASTALNSSAGNGAISLTAASNAYVNAINSGLGNVLVNAYDIFVYGGGLANPNALVGYWKFDEATGNIAYDSSGHSNHGTLVNGPTWSTDTAPTTLAGSHSLSFDGANDFVDIGFNSSLDLKNDATVSFWYKSAGGTNNQGLVSWGQNELAGSNGSSRGLMVLNGGELIARNYNSNVMSGDNVMSGTWRNLTMTIGADNLIKIYDNGVQVSAGAPGLANFAMSYFRIGKTSYSSDELTRGTIDNVRVYNTALSATDVASLYTAAPTWQVGNFNLNATHNVEVDLKGDALTAAAGKNISVAAGNSINGVSAGTLVANKSAGVGGDITLTAGGSGNVAIRDLALNSTGGAVAIISPGSATLGNITAGSIFARTTTASSDITLASNKVLSASGTGNALTLVASRNFINNAGSGALAAPSGRWLVYSANPTDTTGEESLASSFNRYSCSYASIGTCAVNGTLGTTIAIPGSGNGLIYSYTPMLTATASAQSITYGDAAPALSNYGYSLTGYNNGEGTDSVTGSLNGTSTYAQGADVGSYNINYANGTLSSALGYAFAYANNASALTVGKRTLTVGLTGTVSKEYDRTDAATLTASNYSLSNFYSTDGSAVSVSNTSGLYNDKTADTGKNVSVSGLTLTGAKSGNYQLSTTSLTSAIGTITKKALSLIGLSGTNKVYDTTATATLSGTAALSGVIASDNVSIDGTGTGVFADKDVGTAKTITVSGFTITGADAANYSLSQPTSFTANITKAALTVTATGINKVYDALTSGIATLSDNRLGSDSLTLSYTGATYADKDAANGKTLSVSGINVTGTDAGNYTFNTAASTTANITKAVLTASAANQTITYGATVPTTSISYGGFLGSDNAGAIGTVPVVHSAQTGTASVGTYYGNYTLSSGLATNYSFSYVPANLTVLASITPPPTPTPVPEPLPSSVTYVSQMPLKILINDKITTETGFSNSFVYFVVAGETKTPLASEESKQGKSAQSLDNQMVSRKNKPGNQPIVIEISPGLAKILSLSSSDAFQSL